MNQVESAKKFLIDIGADKIDHTGKTLYDHLVATYNILTESAEEEHVCLAGLFHSIYGTQYMDKCVIKDRKIIQDVIGERAERLAWLFCVLERDKFWNDWNKPQRESIFGELVDLTPQEEREFVTLFYANRREQRSREWKRV